MEGIYNAIATGNSFINGIVWGIPALFLLMGAGIFLTLDSRASSSGSSAMP